MQILSPEPQKGNQSGYGGSQQRRFLTEIFDASDVTLRLRTGSGLVVHQSGIASTASAAQPGDHLCLSSFVENADDRLVPDQLYAKSLKLEAGMCWIGREDLAPNLYVYDPNLLSVFAVWIAEAPVVLVTKNDRDIARNMMVPIPVSEDQWLLRDAAFRTNSMAMFTISDPQ